jgi:hypothetical protein
VREILEQIIVRIDAASVADNADALSALRDNGLQMVEPDHSEVPTWREKVSASNHALAQQGVISLELLDEMLGHLEDFRAGNPR